MAARCRSVGADQLLKRICPCPQVETSMHRARSAKGCSFFMVFLWNPTLFPLSNPGYACAPIAPATSCARIHCARSGNSLASIPLPKNDLAREWRQRNPDAFPPKFLIQVRRAKRGSALNTYSVAGQRQRGTQGWPLHDHQSPILNPGWSGAVSAGSASPSCPCPRPRRCGFPGPDHPGARGE